MAATEKLADNPFRSLVDVIGQGVSPAFGWFVMGFGAVMTIAAAFIKKSA